MSFQKAFDSAFCWAGAEPAIAFKCGQCQAPICFKPNEGTLEIGILGGSPTLDPIPVDVYPINVRWTRNNQMLTIEYGEEERSIPSSYLFLKIR
jgi:hypothetical protein